MEIDGTPASERLEGTDDVDFIYGFGGDDTLIGGGGDDWLEGGAGSNLLEGGDGHDDLDGGDGGGTSTVRGGAGDDTIWALDGNEILDGGAGNDYFKVWSSTGVVIATGGAGSDVFAVSDAVFGRDFRVTDFATGPGGDVIDVVKDLMSRANLFYDYIGGNPFDPDVGFLKFEQQGANAVLMFNMGAAWGAPMWAKVLELTGTSVASLTTDNLVDGIPIDGSWGPGYIVQGGTDDEWLEGGFFDDTLTAGAGDDLLEGLGGDDHADGGDGHDLLTGGWGDDTLVGGAGDDTLSPNDGFDLAIGGDGYDVFQLGTSEFGDVRYPASQYDWSLHGATTVTGGAGRDFIEIHRVGEGGSHTISDFQAGIDGDMVDPGMLLDLSAAFGFTTGNPFAASLGYLRLRDGTTGAELQWDLDGAAGTAYQWVTALTFTGVGAASLRAENFAGEFPLDGSALPSRVLLGTAGDDYLFGGGGHETLTGMDGNDILDAGVGDDSLDGGLGDDSLWGGIGNDTLVGGAGHDEFGSEEGEHNTQGDDSLIGGDGDDSFFDEHGDNTLTGGAGDDWFSLLSYDSGKNVATGGTGRDTFSPDDVASTSVVTDFQAGAGGDYIYPLFLVGAQGLEGRHPVTAGYMRLVRDTHGSTLLQYDEDGPGGPGRWVTVLTLQGVDPADITSENFSGKFLVGTAGNDLLVGSWTDDVLQGLAGDDTLDGAGGRDSMEGGAGNDLFYVDDAGDLVIETGVAQAPPGAASDSIGQGIDKVVSSISYTLTAFVENLALAQGVSGLFGQGNELSNVLTAADTGSRLQGHGGNDTLVGGAGVDVAVYARERAAYRIESSGATLSVTDLAGSDGQDSITGFERLQFTDGSLAFDLGGQAGIAARVLAVVFGPQMIANPGAVGLCLQFLGGGGSAEALVAAALDYRLGATRSDAAVVELLYANVTGTPAPQAAVDQFVGMLQAGTYTQAGLGLMAAELELTGAQLPLALLAQQGLAFA